MPAMAVTITPDGWLTDVDMGDPDLRPAHLRRLIGCTAVHPIWLAADLLMWVADTADGFSLNVAATDLVMATANLLNQTIYGTVVCTGPSADGADITPIPSGGRDTSPTTRLSDRSTPASSPLANCQQGVPGG